MSAPITVQTTAIPDVLIVATRWFEDVRGAFTEVYNHATFAAAGISGRFEQENLARSVAAGTVRGLHYQRPPAAQGKLIRVISGAIFDVVVDIRKGSPWFGQWVATELSADDGRQLFVPAGFAHGYCTLAAETLVSYRVNAPYAPHLEAGLLWNDPALAIPWPVLPQDALMAERDRELPTLAETVAVDPAG